MFDEPNDTLFVDPNTDDLDAFSDLVSGKAQVKDDSEVKIEEKVTPLKEDEKAAEVETPEDTDDTGGDDEDHDESQEKPEVKPKKVNRFQERINELTAKAREAERALEALKTAQAPKQDEATKPSGTTVVLNDGPTPDAKNDDGSEKYPLGEFDPQYIRDLARHTIDSEWKVKKEQEAQEQVQRSHQLAREALQEQWVDKLSTVTEKHEDFLDKTMELETAFDGLDANYSDYLVQTIKSLDHGPEVLYYFANHMDEAKNFVKMGPLQATLALGEINAKFKAESRQETKVSKAPPPPQVNKGSKTRTSVAADTDDLDAFAQMLFKKPGRR